MFLLLDRNVIINQSMDIYPLLNQIGFLNKYQYYNYKNGKLVSKFNHIKGRYQIISINQNEFFQENMQWCAELINYEKYL